MGEHGIIVSIVGAFLVTVIGGTLVQLIRRVYIEPIADVKPVAAILTVLLSGLSIGIASFLILFGIIGPVTAAAAGTILGVATAYYTLIFNSYGLESATPEQRQKFDSFKAQFEAGGRAAAIYERTLTRALGAVDRFFGDADPAVPTLWPGAFGFTGRAPFWTASAYDRCLLIALIYPLVMIFAMWGYSGHVGPGETALGLPQATEGWQRLLVIGANLMMLISFYAAENAKRWYNKIIALALAVAFAFAGTIVVADAQVVTVALTGAVAVAVAHTLAGTGAGFIAVAGVISIAVAVAGAISISVTGAVALVVVFVVAAASTVLFIDDSTRPSNRYGIFLGLWSVALLILCYALAAWLGGSVEWKLSAPLILFLGLLTLVNAPFDWLTIGLTRALLRRGLELGGWWPLLLAIADLMMAAVVIVLLGAAMVVAVDAFNAVTVSAGGESVFDLAGTLDGLADPARRSEPEYWWLYATLFSTLIPSIINIAVGALSIIRGWAWLHRMVAGAMTPGRGVLGANLWMAPALALEVLVSIIIGTAAPLGLLWLLFGWLLPAFGTGLIPLLRVVEGLV